ncbi:MAG: TonB-dependent receptor [Microscillaceae bacterium]|nr:TonB-dependent receptor [Microscillaceae bacterium]MDW8461706.1 TonB-dependent receptor [Cytophagales bacterium]
MNFLQKKPLGSWVLVLIALNTFAQSKFTISGYLKDAQNGEALIAATVFVNELKVGVTSNTYGFYSLSLPAGSYTLTISYIGYKTQTLSLSLNQNLIKNFELQPDNLTLSEVEVTSEKSDENIRSVEMSVNKLDIKTIKKIPALLGEVDVIRSIQLLPGVSTVGEGAAGFNVRGGTIDQNLVLLDEAPVYNTSHALGFFSVFNPDLVKDVKLVKGGVAAQYGGRLASLLDVRLKEGNLKKWEVNGGIGLIFSRLTVEAPIIKDKASFIIGGRRSYFDLFFPLSNNPDVKNSTVYFYDLTAKANYIINARNRIYVSGYFGRDVLGFAGGNFGFDWGSTTATVRWNHLFSDKLFFNLTTFYSKYDYRLKAGTRESDDGFDWRSNILNYSVKPELTWFLNAQNTLNFGGQALFYTFKPGSATFKSLGTTNRVYLPDKYALENALYLSNDQTLNEKILLQYGLRYSWFSYLGKGTSQTYAEAPAGTRRELISEKQFDMWQTIQQYGFLEPRFSINYKLSPKTAFKASYNRMAQYIHLVSNTTASIPLDVWTPSTNNIRPQIADQVALGYFQNFGENDDYEFSAETYYKDMQNQIDYIDGADLLLNRALEGDLLNGKGRAYGLELYFRKNTGKLTGWLSYTLARSERQVQGINQGRWYPNRFDKAHNFYAVALYQINPRWSVSATAVFGTGTPTTFPTARYEFQGLIVPHNTNDERNNYRIPPYHRLDIAVTYTPSKNNNRRLKGEWVFSIYNVYASRNPFSIFFRQSIPRGELAALNAVTEAIKFSVVSTLIPSVSYNFRF